MKDASFLGLVAIAAKHAENLPPGRQEEVARFCQDLLNRYFAHESSDMELCVDAIRTLWPDRADQEKFLAMVLARS